MRLILLSIAFAGLAGNALAQEPKVDCENQVSQLDMNTCAWLDYEAADAELNKVWKEAVKSAKEMDAEETEETSKGAEKALLGAQRGWIAYRDGRCVLAGWEAHGGSMEPGLVGDCRAEMTRARTKELKDFASGEE